MKKGSKIEEVKKLWIKWEENCHPEDSMSWPEFYEESTGETL